MILPNGATVAVVDGRTMLLFQNIGHDPEIDLSPLSHPRLGESHAGSGGRHRNSTANPDPARLAEDDFAATVSNALNRAVLAGEIVRLLIIADSRTLGEMRRHFHKSLQDKLLGEMTKDMTGHSKNDIEAAIRAA
ncbi:host attachment family protein [Shinella sp.]|uniref:host attachment family protein n=1 Tax=Shinella sp. TaxID=1870904 RepID=UPI0029A13FE5|nr:host attachment protein [Shinella sp.]MDX3972539.1 host attachment protein [Shinella sp.]